MKGHKNKILLILAILLTIGCSGNSDSSDPTKSERELLDTDTTNPDGASSSATLQEQIISALLVKRDSNSWLIDITNDRDIPFADGFVTFPWSVSGKYMLLYYTPVEGRGLYLANADGSNLSFISNEFGSPSFESQWLTDDLVLLQFYLNHGTEYVIHLLNIEDKRLERVEHGHGRIIEAVSPSGDFWIQSVYQTGTFELATPEGDVIEILHEFPGFQKSKQPFTDPNIVFTPFGESIIFDACEGPEILNENTCYIYLAEVSANGVGDVLPIFNLGNLRNVSYLQVSPDGKYLSFINHKQEIVFINLDNYVIDYQWPWANHSNYYFWSPNSKSIVYESFDEEIQQYRGLSIMEIETGEEVMVTDGESVERVFDWQFISLGD